MAKSFEAKLESLAAALIKLRTTDEIKAFLQDLFTKSEQESLASRLQIARLLDEGLPYTQIERETGASSATIAKVSENLKYGYDGYKLVLERTKK